MECCRANRRKKRHQRQPPQSPPQAPGIHATETEPISQIATFQSKSARRPRAHRRRRHNRKTTTHVTVTSPLAVRLDHHIFSKREWKRACLRDHPRLPITISLSRPGRTASGTYNKSSDIYAEVSAIADTGAQSDLWSLSDFIACLTTCYSTLAFLPHFPIPWQLHWYPTRKRDLRQPATCAPRLARKQRYAGPQRWLTSTHQRPQRHVLVATARSSTATSLRAAVPL